jgi:hypothetical protein
MINSRSQRIFFNAKFIKRHIEILLNPQIGIQGHQKEKKKC